MSNNNQQLEINQYDTAWTNAGGQQNSINPQTSMNQQYYGQQGYTNQQQYYGQQGYTNQQQYYGQQGYANQQQYYTQTKQPSKIVGDIKNVQSEFKGKVNKMGLSVYCLLGIIAAMLLIVAPFMNFASVHVNEKVKISKVYVKVKVSDGLNLFELAKASGTVDRAADKKDIDKDDIVDEMEDEVEDEMEDDISESTINEIVGTAHLIIKGQVALYVIPWILIISGIGLLIFTVINNKKLKLVFSIVPLVCFIWLMICSSSFFSIMGIGAWAILVGIILGITSALKDKPAYN